MIPTHSDLIVAVIQNKIEAFFMKEVNIVYFTKVLNTEGSCVMLLLGPGKIRISQKSH